MAKNVENEYEKLKQLIPIEELKNCIAGEIKIHIDERKTETAYKLAILADKYTVTHKRSKGKTN